MGIIKTNNLTKIYGNKVTQTKVLNDINLEVNKGEFLAIMGPSGSGKTTLLNLLSTIDNQTSGNIIFDNKNLIDIKKNELARFRRDNIGFIFQDYNLLDNMTIEDNISLPLALNKVSHTEIKGKVTNLSKLFGITEQLKKYPYQLSGGQKQRVAAARALITEPKVIFADEPTGALDSKAATDLLNCLVDMNNKFNTTIIMVTHDAYAASFCRRVLFLADGKIYAKLNKDSSRNDLYQRILKMMATLGGGEKNECV